jgi:hypothetical protein
MRYFIYSASAAGAIALAIGAVGTPAALAQGHTYPGYFGNTPSASYYELRNPYDEDTYMNPNPFPSYSPLYRSPTYEEPAYRPNLGYTYPPPVSAMYPYNTYPPPVSAPRLAKVYPPPTPAPSGFNRYSAAAPTSGYYHEGPFVYSHYDRSGRMAFRYGWW